jgi:hypothetical protein
LGRGKIQVFAWILSIFVFSSGAQFAMSGAQDESASQIIHTPVSIFTYGEFIELSAQTSMDVEWIRVFFRYQGLEEYQVRNMDQIEDRKFNYTFDTSQLPGLEFEYYIVASITGETFSSPTDAPVNTYKVLGESVETLPEIPEEFPDVQEEAKKKRFKLPMNITGSATTRIADNQSDADQNTAAADGNIRVFTTYNRRNLGVNFDSNFNYTSNPMTDENQIDLSNMMVTVSQGNHSLSAGDISINESEYSVYGLGRRGMEYTYNHQKAYVHVFDVSTQQAKGFSGFGIPKKNISLFGGAFGYKLFNSALSMKAVYLTGKDDPALGANIGYLPYNQSRKGNVVALVQEASLMQNRLMISGEVARSDYDGDLSDSAGKVQDTAWRLGGNFSTGIFTLGANYRRIGKEFNPIGHQYFTNDRQGVETSVGVNLGKVSVSGSYIYSSDNVENVPTEYTTRNHNGNLNLMWAITENVSLNLGYRLDDQETSLDEGDPLFDQDSLTNEIRGTLNFNLNQNVMINFSLSNSIQSSEKSPQNDRANLTVNLGGNFRVGNFLSMMPTIGFTESTNRYTDQTMQTFNTFLSAELIFIPQLLTTSLSGSYMSSDTGYNGTSTSFNISGNLNFYLQKFLKVGNTVLTLKTNYTSSKMSGFSNSYYAVLAQLDFSF